MPGCILLARRERSFLKSLGNGKIFEEVLMTKAELEKAKVEILRLIKLKREKANDK